MKALEKYDDYWDLGGRLMVGGIFLLQGVGKVRGYAGTAGYMESAGVPGILLPLVILTEIGCGLGLILGFKTKLAAFLLAGFTIISALLFHQLWNDSGQYVGFIKNIMIAGGLLVILRNGAGPLSMDAKSA